MAGLSFSASVSESTRGCSWFDPDGPREISDGGACTKGRRNTAGGNPQRTDRPHLTPLSHSFTLDFIACFQSEKDARRFLVELRERLAAFALEVEPTKTGLIRFGSAAPGRCQQDGLRRPKTFGFLGFTHYVSRSRRGHFVVGRRTERKRFRRKLGALNERLRALRVRGGTAMLTYFRQHMQGHIHYYGVSGNHRQLAAYAYFASRLLYKWLNRRSQRRSTTWAGFRTTLHGRWLPPLRIHHNLYPVPVWKTQAGSRMV